MGTFKDLFIKEPRDCAPNPKAHPSRVEENRRETYAKYLSECSGYAGECLSEEEYFRRYVQR